MQTLKDNFIIWHHQSSMFLRVIVSLPFSYSFFMVPLHRNHLNTHYCIMCCPCVVVRDQSDCEPVLLRFLMILLDAASNVLVHAGSECL